MQFSYLESCVSASIYIYAQMTWQQMCAINFVPEIPTWEDWYWKSKLKLWLARFIQDHCHTLTWIPEILFMLRELKNNEGKLGLVGGWQGDCRDSLDLIKGLIKILFWNTKLDWFIDKFGKFEFHFYTIWRTTNSYHSDV